MRYRCPLAGVDEDNSLLSGVDAHDVHDGSKDLLIVASHTGLAVVDNGGANLDATAVQKELALLGTVVNEGLGTSQVLGSVQGGDIEVLEAGDDLEGLCLGNELENPVLGVTDEDNDGDGHAALTGGAEASAGKGVEGILLVAVRHESGVVLGTHVALGALAGSGGTGVDVFSGSVGTDEGNGLDVGVVVDHHVDGVVGTVDNVDNAIWDSGLLKELDHDLGGAGDLLGGLEHVGVTEGDGEG